MQAVPKIKKTRPLDLTTPRLRAILLCARWDLPRSIRIPNLTFLTSLIPNLWKEVKIKNGSWTSPRPFWVHLATCEMGLAKIYPYTKFDISSFIIPDLGKGV